MDLQVSVDKVYKPSEDVVARDVAGEFIIIPIASGIGDLEDEIFSLNETGRAIWEKLTTGRTLKDIARELSEEYETAKEAIEKDCVGLIGELLKRKIVVDRTNN